MNHQKLVQEIIKLNAYLSLSTYADWQPWIAPLAYVYDKKYNFYFVSPTDSVHGKHIVLNKNVAFAIFDSQQKVGTGMWIQASGTCEIIPDWEYPKEVIWYLEVLKAFPIRLDKYVVFRIIPTTFFLPNAEAWDNEGIDSRILVDMN